MIYSYVKTAKHFVQDFLQIKNKGCNRVFESLGILIIQKMSSYQKLKKKLNNVSEFCQNFR